MRRKILKAQIFHRCYRKLMSWIRRSTFWLSIHYDFLLTDATISHPQSVMSRCLRTAAFLLGEREPLIAHPPCWLLTYTTRVHTASPALYVAHRPTVSGDDARSVHSYSDSSDTERRQPNFPGNRDIIDSRFPSTSPSPPTQHSAELETPSPVSDAP